MFDKPQATHSLGLEIDGPLLKGAVLSYVRGKPRLDSFFDFPIEFAKTENEEDVKPLYNDVNKNQLEALSHKHLVVTTLPSNEVLVRPLDLKIKKEKDIDSVLSFQSEPLLPYPVENALIDRIIISKDKEGHKLSILAVRKDHLIEHIKQWNSIDIEPEDVTASSAALASFTKYFSSNEDLLYTLHIGLASTLCILTDKGKLLAAQSLNKGVNTLAEALIKDEDIDLSTAYQRLNETNFSSELQPTLKESLELFRLDITRTIYALAKLAKGQNINSLFVTGDGAGIDNLINALCSSLGKTILSPQPNQNFNVEVKELQKFAIPIGAGLSVLPNSQEQINFRQQELTFPAPWKRLKKPLALYLLLCFGIAIALVLFGKAFLSYREAELKQQYLDLLKVMNKPYTQFEKEYASKNSQYSNEVVSINDLNQNEIKERLNLLEKELQSMPQFYPLQPNVPSVSDVLAWLAAHPNAVGPTPASGELTPSLHIENFSYTMLKRPELSKKQEKYQVKVELEFTSPTPKMAREFHDALVAPNELVDAKSEIKWNSNRDKYRTSFYLKDKTIYPTP